MSNGMQVAEGQVTEYYQEVKMPIIAGYDSDRYRNIKTEENYMSLLKSGMFWEFHPELTGNWYLDEPVINGR